MYYVANSREGHKKTIMEAMSVDNILSIEDLSIRIGNRKLMERVSLTVGEG